MDEEESSSMVMTVVDVYDIASLIGKEFEKLIETHGAEVVTGLMPKVICALEHLEDFAAKCESENVEIGQLKTAINQLQTEKHESAEYRHRFEQEIEQIEDSWKEETKDLNNIVSRLQEENYRLKNCLSEYQSSADGNLSVFNEEELKVAEKLKEIVDKQRERLHAYERESIQKKNELETLQCQVEKLTKTTNDLKKRYRSTQKQMKMIIDEKSELQAQVQEQERELQVLKDNLGTAVKENEDLVRSKAINEILELKNKVVIDLDDPNRPRFTLREVKKILNERNELKARLCEIQDEMDFMRRKQISPNSTPEHRRAESPSPSVSSNLEEELLPVHGPINKEPIEKLYPNAKKPSFIRKMLGI
ncbi:RILPL1 (predicted) [Pycnogonum litorale]